MKVIITDGGTQTLQVDINEYLKEINDEWKSNKTVDQSIKKR